MKKILLLAAVFATLSLASCSSKDEKANNGNNDPKTEDVKTEKTAADYAKEVAALMEQLNNCTNEADAVKIQEKGDALEKEIEAKGLTEQVKTELMKLVNN